MDAADRYRLAYLSASARARREQIAGRQARWDRMHDADLVHPILLDRFRMAAQQQRKYRRPEGWMCLLGDSRGERSHWIHAIDNCLQVRFPRPMDKRPEHTGPCPSCGTVATRRAYDIGSGPELSCANCEWCWGAEGQDLSPVSLQGVRQAIDEGKMP